MKNIFTILLSCLFFFLHAVVYCQNSSKYTDSLESKLKTAKDTARITVLYALAEKLLDLATANVPAKDSLIRQSNKYVTEAQILSRQLNNVKGIGLANIFYGDIKVTRSLKNMDSALVDYENAVPWLKLAGDKKDLATCYNDIASGCHFVGYLDKSTVYYDSTIAGYLAIKDTFAATASMIWQGHSFYDKGDYKNAYLYGARALKAAEKGNDKDQIIFANLQLSAMYLGAGLPENAIMYLHKIIALHPLTLPQNGKTTLPYNINWAFWLGGEAFIQLNQVDSAIYLSKYIPEDTTDGDSERFFGQIYTALHQDDKALALFVRGFQKKIDIGHEIGTAGIAIELGQLNFKRKDFEHAIYYTRYGLAIAQRIHALLEMKNAVGILNDIYSAKGDYYHAYQYSQLYKSLNDSLASEQDRRKLSLQVIQNELDNQKQEAQLLNKDNQLKQQQLNSEQLVRKIFIGGTLALLAIAVFIYRSYKQKQKANVILENQKKEIQTTLSDLKSAQQQLIQSEKMASLGQLTAGIAHEIQNPLNFVNNFSEVNKELLAEMNEEIDKENFVEAKAIAKDVIENEEKINHHGKRADAIVKGMLQHSRSSTNVKEPTNINALADEYLRLAYHGLRAKDKSFNATMKTDYDESIGNINIVPQDIGRVILNLITNAFYAVAEKKKLNGDNYDPIVSVSTKRSNNKIEIRVADNGNGMPQNVLDKIFQPFFTTKPTGQGTGLGLSLSYDIIKAHGGEIKVETKEGEGSEFIIVLPVV